MRATSRSIHSQSPAKTYPSVGTPSNGCSTPPSTSSRSTLHTKTPRPRKASQIAERRSRMPSIVGYSAEECHDLARYDWHLACVIALGKGLEAQDIPLVKCATGMQGTSNVSIRDEIAGTLVKSEHESLNHLFRLRPDSAHVMEAEMSFDDRIYHAIKVSMEIRNTFSRTHYNQRAIAVRLHKAYTLFLLDRRIIIRTTFLDNIRQLGVFTVSRIDKACISKDDLIIQFIIADLEFTVPPLDIAQTSQEECKVWRSAKMKEVGIGDDTLAEAQDESRWGGVSICLGPARFVNNTHPKHAQLRPMKTTEELSNERRESIEAMRGGSDAPLAQCVVSPLILKGNVQPAEGVELYWSYGSNHAY